jgi:hypothetical protein
MAVLVANTIYNVTTEKRRARIAKLVKQLGYGLDY